MGSDRLSSKLGLNEQEARIEDLAEEAPVGLVEVAGFIKWFDVSKGYGFIVPDNGMADVLLHVTCLRRDGFQTAYEGARIVVEAQQRSKGMQAFRIVSMDESTAVHPSQLPPRTHVNVTPTSGQMVQPSARFRFSHARRGHTRHLRAYGNAAALWADRTPPWPSSLGPLWRQPQRPYGRRSSARYRHE